MDSDQFQNKIEHNAGSQIFMAVSVYGIFVNSIKIQ